MIEGYNIKLKLNNKTVLAVTQDDLSVSANTKESVTKDDAGVKQTAVTGQEVTFTVAGLVALKGQTATAMDADDMLAQSLKTGAAAVIPFEYVRGTGKAYTGNCIMTAYSESAPADPDSDSTFSASFKVSGAMTMKS